MNAQRKSTTHEEMYFQIKQPLTKGNRSFTRGTVFFRNEGTGEGSAWFGSVARCSVGDIFCKKVGRSVARRHYFGNGPRVGGFPEQPTYEDALLVYKAI